MQLRGAFRWGWVRCAGWHDRAKDLGLRRSQPDARRRRSKGVGRVRVRVRVSGGRAGSREGSTRFLDAVYAALRRPLGRSQLGGSQGLFGRAG